MFTASSRPVNSSTSPIDLQTTSATVTSGAGGGAALGLAVLEQPATTTANAVAAAARRVWRVRNGATIPERKLEPKFMDLSPEINSLLRVFSKAARNRRGVCRRPSTPDDPGMPNSMWAPQRPLLRGRAYATWYTIG